MADDSPGTTVHYVAAYRGGRDAVLAVVSGALWVGIGVVGVGLLWMTAIALSNGTATPATFAAALFGTVLTVLSGDELIHRLVGGTPVFS